MEALQQNSSVTTPLLGAGVFKQPGEETISVPVDGSVAPIATAQHALSPIAAATDTTRTPVVNATAVNTKAMSWKKYIWYLITGETDQYKPFGNFLFFMIFVVPSMAGDVLFAFLLKEGGATTLQSMAAAFGYDFDEETASWVAFGIALLDVVALGFTSMHIENTRRGIWKTWFAPSKDPTEDEIAEKISKMANSSAVGELTADGTERSIQDKVRELALTELRAEKHRQFTTNLKLFTGTLSVLCWVIGSFAPFIAFAHNPDWELKWLMAGLTGWVLQFVLYVLTAGSKPKIGAEQIATALKKHKEPSDPTWRDYSPTSPALAFSWFKSLINSMVRALTFAFLAVEIIPSFGVTNQEVLDLTYYIMLAVGFTAGFNYNFLTQSVKELNNLASHRHKARLATEAYEKALLTLSNKGDSATDADRKAVDAAAQEMKKNTPSIQKTLATSFIPQCDRNAEGNHIDDDKNIIPEIGWTAWMLQSLLSIASLSARALALPAFIYSTFNQDAPDGSLIPANLLWSTIAMGFFAYSQWPTFILIDGAKGWDYFFESIGWGVHGTYSALASKCTSSNQASAVIDASTTTPLIINRSDEKVGTKKSCWASLFTAKRRESDADSVCSDGTMGVPSNQL